MKGRQEPEHSSHISMTARKRDRMIPTRRKKQAIAEEYGFSLHFMDKVIAGLRKNAARYPNGVITSGHVCIIDVEMMLDWIKYREALEVRSPVPPFRREEYLINEVA